MAISDLKAFSTNGNMLTCRVHPLVVMSILDAYVRRPEGEDRVIGTLMGYVSEGNVLDVVDCFTVVHSDTQEKDVTRVLMELGYHRRMVALKQAAHPKEQVIGWFSAGARCNLTSDHISVHSFYSDKEQSLFQATQFLPSPVLLQIDTSCRGGQMNIEVFTQAITSKNLCEFHQIPLEKSTFNQEKELMNMLLHARSEEANTGEKPILSKLDSFSKSLDELLQLFESAKEYTQNVIDGNVEENSSVGRSLSSCLTSEALLDEEKFDALCQGAMKDTIMTMYLSDLTKTQVALSEAVHQALTMNA